MTNTPTHTAHRPTPVGTPERSHLLERLDVEWAHLRTSRRALRTARSWAERYPDHPLADLVEGLTDLEQIRRATQRRDGAERSDDTILLALVELARSDELAGRIILQHLLPALISNARRYRSYTDRADPIAQIVPAAWLAIRSYDVERRRHHVAASLTSDAVFQAFRRQLRRCAASEEATAPGSFAGAAHHDGPATALDEFVTVLREARRAGVPAYDLDLLRQLVRVGSPGIVAQQRKVTPRTVRNHRDRAVDHVRTALVIAVAA
ncbi:MAG TPA: hypothetical protein VMW33_06600 [Ilumatobacteraceae bacterium]|nr:hypothetical protein [Ilumatobacteraceae bacterium]